jgi:hypothetical protein
MRVARVALAAAGPDGGRSSLLLAPPTDDLPRRSLNGSTGGTGTRRLRSSLRPRCARGRTSWPPSGQGIPADVPGSRWSRFSAASTATPTRSAYPVLVACMGSSADRVGGALPRLYRPHRERHRLGDCRRRRRRWQRRALNGTRPMSTVTDDIEAAWGEVFDALPLPVGRQRRAPRMDAVRLRSFRKASVGLRSREWQAIGATGLDRLREMARCACGRSPRVGCRGRARTRPPPGDGFPDGGLLRRKGTPRWRGDSSPLTPRIGARSTSSLSARRAFRRS